MILLQFHVIKSVNQSDRVGDTVPGSQLILLEASGSTDPELVRATVLADFYCLENLLESRGQHKEGLAKCRLEIVTETDCCEQLGQNHTDPHISSDGPKWLHAKTSLKIFVGKPTTRKASTPHFLSRRNDQGTYFRIFQRARLVTFYKDAISMKCSLKA